VAALARNCPEQVEAFFACAMTGLVLVPLNSRLTARELACQLGDAGPAVPLAGPSLEALGKEAAAAAGCEVSLPTGQGAAHPGGEITTAQPFGEIPCSSSAPRAPPAGQGARCSRTPAASGRT
jgi:acyl-CoA synthetase (AMP-forming)/AMP-acid ligase II